MYSFRYHLVAVCSVLVALALGLLLGAAIASSELAQTTQSDMVESMLQRYESLVDSNARLEDAAAADLLFTDAILENWKKERLNGRTIVVMFGTTASDAAQSSVIAEAISRAGGSVVSITVQRDDFGLGDEATRTALLKIVEEEPNESYHRTLANRLVEEWSYQFPLTLPEPTQEDLDLESYTYRQPSGQSDTSPLDLNGGLEPKTALQRQLFEQYPLTRALLALEIISIDADYSFLEEYADPAAHKEQLAALNIATAWQLPYGVNGFVNGFISTNDVFFGGINVETQMGLLIAFSMQEAALDERLQFATWYRAGLSEAQSEAGESSNYHVLLIQADDIPVAMDAVAASHNLSCVTTPQTMRGQYSVIALLSGAEAGIYGDDRPPEKQFAPPPEDQSGRAAFKDGTDIRLSVTANGTADDTAENSEP